MAKYTPRKQNNYLPVQKRGCSWESDRKASPSCGRSIWVKAKDNSKKAWGKIEVAEEQMMLNWIGWKKKMKKEKKKWKNLIIMV